MSDLESRLFFCGKHCLDLKQPQVMGILNVTPDSFSDGGRHQGLDQALRHAEQMLKEGATLIDIGGESTRPGAAEVSEQEELDRVVPIVEAVVARFDALVSVDTSTAAVITASAKVGASLINDVRALEREGALAAAAATGLPVCLMHMQGQPKNMQLNPSYNDVLLEVKSYLQARITACHAAGIKKQQILLDPGFGFGKTVTQNYSLLKNLQEIEAMGYPLLIGTSRKSMIGAVTGREVDERLAGSLATVVLAVERGASIIRVHDVAATVDAIKIAHSMLIAP